MSDPKYWRIATLSLIIINLVLIIIIFLNSKGIAKLDNVLSIIGTLTTAIAFLIGCYFAVLAVSAYSHHRDIEKIKSDVQDESKNISNLKIRTIKVSNEILELRHTPF